VKSTQVAKRSASSDPPVRRVAGILLFLLVIIFFASISAHAADITGTSNTYLRASETVDGGKLLPLYEYLDLSVQNPGTQPVSIHLGGWLRYDLREASFGEERNNGALSYGYVSYRGKARNAVVNLGRVMVFEGVAAERVDGIYARTDVMGGLGISAFGGVPVETSIDLPGSNTIYGGRISHQDTGLYTIGLSYLKEEKNSETFRQEAGVDLWIKPVNKVELSGRSSFNTQTTGWMENSYFLMLGPFDKLRVNTEASWISYEDYFAATTNNAFKLSPGGPLDPKEKLNILGPELFYAINNNWSVSADYKQYAYEIAGKAGYYGARATYNMPASYSAGISLHKMDGDTNRLKYDEYRIYAAKRMARADIAVDLLDVKYKEAINNVSDAYSATLAAGYETTKDLKLGADLEYSKNPDFDEDVRIFVKLIYRFGADLGKRKGV
jgi:hypothetical protein